MKKLFIPLVALLALAACSKVVPTTREAGEREVTFEVANYAASTKANDPKSLAQEFDSFHTFAIFHSTDPDNPNQWYFEDEEIFAQGDGNNVTKWAPSGPHFWPKTGDISFYSYAGTRQPSQWPEPGKEDDASRIMSFGVNLNAGQNQQADFEPLVIRGIPEVMNVVEVDPTTNTGADAGQIVRPDNNGAYPAGTPILPADNILVADPAYKFQESVADPYGVDALNPAKGVPTLFNHMLAKVRFRLVLDATKSDANTTWTLSLLENQQLLSVPNQGSLVVTYSAPKADEFNQTGSLASADWTVVTASSDQNETISKGEMWARPLELVAGGEGNPATAEGDLLDVPEIEGQTFVREFVVIPQRYDKLEFQFTCILSNVYNGGEKPEPGVTEMLTIPANSTMGMFIPNYNPQKAYYWERNHIYTYTITVKTNGEITFDPAVVDWINEEEIKPVF